MAKIIENPVQNLAVSRNPALDDAKSSKSLKKAFQQSGAPKQVTEADNSQVNHQDKVDHKEDTVKIQNLRRLSMGGSPDHSNTNVEQAQRWIEEVKGTIRSESDTSRFDLVHNLNNENMVRLLA